MNFKVVVYGTRGVGKSSLVYRLIDGRFDEKPKVYDDEKCSKMFEIDGECVLMEVVDIKICTEEYTQYTALRDDFRDADGFLIVYDITSTDSLEQASVMIDQVGRLVACVFSS